MSCRCPISLWGFKNEKEGNKLSLFGRDLLYLQARGIDMMSGTCGILVENDVFLSWVGKCYHLRFGIGEEGGLTLGAA